jgi:leucyl/phenylalanyl-tRNA--protein transferase
MEFPAATTADDKGRVTTGGDLEPGTILAAYRSGLFPMRQPNGELTWWSPDPRAFIAPDRLHIGRTLRRAVSRFSTTVDADFEAVIDGCANRAADEFLWITPEIRDAFVRLHRLGWAHSVEAWTIPTGDNPPTLAGGLYGLAIGGLFSGESMFHRLREASKVALVALVDLLRSDEHNGKGRLIDVQWLTPHMASLGAIEISRGEYLRRLDHALALPLPEAFTFRQDRSRES